MIARVEKADEMTKKSPKPPANPPAEPPTTSLADEHDELLVAHHRLLHEYRCLEAAHANTGPERKQIEAQHAEIETWLRKSLNAREREVQEMRASTSWRVTSPLRRLSGLLLALRQRLRA